MKAGPELNKLVAEKVMGWNLKKINNASFWIGEQDALEEGWLLDHMWEPSTDISDAWYIVDKFPFVDIRKRPKGYSVEIPGKSGMVNQVESEAPLAICIAALKAVGVVGIE